jgi:hypothetical protein
MSALFTFGTGKMDINNDDSNSINLRLIQALPLLAAPRRI